MYKSAENGFGAFDFSGTGYITEEGLLNHFVIRDRTPFTPQQMKLFVEEYNLFPRGSKGMVFDGFKKMFFPQQYFVQDPPDDEEENKAKENKVDLLYHGERQSAVIEERLAALEKKLKIKFGNCFESVRKAFLLLDMDHDGYVTIEDFLKYLGNDPTLNYSDLKKLMIDKDSKKQGRLNYSDFSRWLGNSIYMNEGFYFRHDSIKNTNYE